MRATSKIHAVNPFRESPDTTAGTPAGWVPRETWSPFLSLLSRSHKMRVTRGSALVWFVSSTVMLLQPCLVRAQGMYQSVRPYFVFNTAVAMVEDQPQNDEKNATQNNPALQKVIFDAAQAGDLEKVKELLGQGIDVNVQDPIGGGALLHIASIGGHEELVRFLLSKGADVNLRDGMGKTPLFHAASTGPIEVVKVLIAGGADINAQDNRGRVPLGAARQRVRRGDTEVFEFLTKALEEQKKTEQPGNPEQAAKTKEQPNRELMMAVMQGQEERVKELLSQGADINALSAMLHTTVISRNDKSTLLLLNNGASVDVRDENGRTPLHVAAGAGFPMRPRRANVVEMLLEKGADINAKDNSGLMPLHCAVMRGLEGIVDFLLEHNADVNAKDVAGKTPLHYAGDSVNGLGIAKVLIDRNVDVNVQDSFGLTPLHLAVARGRKEMVVMLLDHNATVDLKDNAGHTPLHFAAGGTSLNGRPLEGVDEGTLIKDSLFMVECLLSHGADINIRDKILGWTPLHCAVRIDFYEPIVEFLLKRGADPTIMDNRGLVPLAMIPRIVHQQRAHIALPQRIINYKSMADLLRIYTNVYYVSPDGNDSNPGTINNPFRSIHEAIVVVGPGDTIFVRAGTYTLKDTIHLYRSGYAGRRITLKAYPGESPVFDCLYAKDAGIILEASYWHIKGLTIINAYSAGIRIEGEGAHHNIIEETAASNNQIGGISNIDKAAFNMIVNCDAYKNFSAEMDGGDADGFSMYYGVGEGNVIAGCRSWNNSDDGFDLFYAGNSVRLERCYSFHNGDNIWNYPLFVGDMNGFKLGGGEGRHILINCLSWGHGLTGATMAGNMSGVLINNCTFWDNNMNYAFEWTGWPEEGRKSNVFTNNISFEGKSRDRFHENARSQSNSWDATLALNLTASDFLSLDDSQMSAPRNPDGSIPHNNFLRLAPGSAAIDKGTDVGMPFVGAQPDLGAFEYDPNQTSEGYVKMLHQAVRDHDVEEINKLLAAGEGVNEKDWLGYTPLHWAVYFGYPDLIELLISKGADPDIQSDTGRYALEIARAMAYPELEVLLRKLGAKAGEVTAGEESQEVNAAEEQTAGEGK